MPISAKEEAFRTGATFPPNILNQVKAEIYSREAEGGFLLLLWNCQ
jgi:hypothetical protein